MWVWLLLLRSARNRRSLGKNVCNRPIVGYSSIGGELQDLTVRRLLQEIAELKTQLALSANSGLEERVALVTVGQNTDGKSGKYVEEADAIGNEAEGLRVQCDVERQKAKKAGERAEELKCRWQRSKEEQLGEEEAMRREKLEFMEKCRERELRAAREAEEAREERKKSEKEMGGRIARLEELMRDAFLSSHQNELTGKLSGLVEQLRSRWWEGTYFESCVMQPKIPLICRSEIQSSYRDSVRSSLYRAEERRVRQLGEQRVAYEEALRSKEMQWRYWQADMDARMGKMKRAFLR